MAKINLVILIYEKIVKNGSLCYAIIIIRKLTAISLFTLQFNGRNINSKYCLNVHFGLIDKTLTEFFFLNFIIDGTAYNRSKYADKTKYCKYKKNYFNADKKIGIVLRTDLDISHKNQHNK